ncbi:MAG: glycosyltransferase family 4 protein [Bacillota bacterium]
MSKAEISVAMIEPVGGHGGMNYYDFELCQGLRNSNVDISLYTCTETVVLDTLQFDVHTHFQNIYGKDSKWLRAARYMKGLLKSYLHARKEEKKIAHFHIFQITMLEWLTVKLARWFGFRIVVTAHDVESFADNNQSQLVSSVYEMADRVIAHNMVSKRELVEKLGLHPDKINTIPHGHYINTIGERLTKEAARAKLKLQVSGPVLLFFGQIKKVKGLEVLLEALSIVKQSQPSVKLLIAGKLWNNDFSVYEPIIAKHGLEENLILHIRYIPVEWVDAYFQAADMVVLPYRKIYQSGVLLQSMSYGRPVVVSDIEGMTEVVTNGKTGYVFKEGSPQHLADKLIEALSDKTEMENMGQHGFESIQSRHDWSEIGRTTANAYSAAMK